MFRYYLILLLPLFLLVLVTPIPSGSERVLTKDVDLNMLVHLEGKQSISAYESKIKNNVQRSLQMKTSKIVEDIPQRM